jgi:segregation and condensation protein A
MSGIISGMSFDIATNQARSYRVATEVYEGPLDLLLHLIERAELDITKLALAQVTDQYLEHLKQLPERAADEVSSFLVIASRLLQIKSEVLLPRPPLREAGEEDPGEALARQLLAYKRFKEIANLLDQRQEEGLRTYLRLAQPARIGTAVDLSGIDLSDLVDAARSVYARLLLEEDFPSLDSVVSAPKITIRQKISLIAGMLRERGHVSFQAMLGDARTRLEVVVTFLAVLELVKLHFVQVRQEHIFGEIEIESTGDWEMGEELDLEFGE